MRTPNGFLRTKFTITAKITPEARNMEFRPVLYGGAYKFSRDGDTLTIEVDNSVVGEEDYTGYVWTLQIDFADDDILDPMRAIIQCPNANYVNAGVSSTYINFYDNINGNLAQWTSSRRVQLTCFPYEPNPPATVAVTQDLPPC